jgi:hypothetical protein
LEYAAAICSSSVLPGVQVDMENDVYSQIGGDADWSAAKTRSLIVGSQDAL